MILCLVYVELSSIKTELARHLIGSSELLFNSLVYIPDLHRRIGNRDYLLSKAHDVESEA